MVMLSINQDRSKSSRKRKNATNALYPQRQDRRFNPLVNSLTTAQILNAREDEEMWDQGQFIPLQRIRPTHYEEQPSTHLQFLRDEFGTVAPYPSAQNPPRVGICAIAGCSQTQFQLEGGGSHHCHRCGIVVHNTERSWFADTRQLILGRGNLIGDKFLGYRISIPFPLFLVFHTVWWLENNNNFLLLDPKYVQIIGFRQMNIITYNFYTGY
jgi:hypothetical protein